MKKSICLILFLLAELFAFDCNQNGAYNLIMDASDRVHNWSALVKYYKTYGACDEGEVSDQNTSIIELLFQDNWSSFWNAKLFEKHPDVWEFVLKHIDDSWVIGKDHWFFKLAAFQCPEKYPDACAAIMARIQPKNEPAVGIEATSRDEPEPQIDTPAGDSEEEDAGQGEDEDSDVELGESE